MADKKSNKPTFTFREPTPKELKEMYPDDMERKAAQAAMEERKIKEETEANKGRQSPKEAKAMLEEKKGMKAGGALKAPASSGLKKLPTKVRNKMGYMKAGGSVKKCKRDGIAVRGRTKGRMV